MNRPALNLTTEQLFNANRAAIKSADLRHPDAIKARAHIDGTAYTALRIVQREILGTALRYRTARELNNPVMMRANTMAIRALGRVRQQLREAYPTAKPFHAARTPNEIGEEG